MIKGDSIEYDLLAKWADFDCNGYYSCEIGVRDGMGSKTIMDNIKNNYMHIGVDPYANLRYQHYDNSHSYTADYTDEMRDTMLNDLKEYRNNGKFHLANMPDKSFMTSAMYYDNVFAFVHFDGPHMTKDVITEAVWFANKSAPNTRFVFDDYHHYKMDQIALILGNWNFKTIEAGRNKIMLEKK